MRSDDDALSHVPDHWFCLATGEPPNPNPGTRIICMDMRDGVGLMLVCADRGLSAMVYLDVTQALILSERLVNEAERRLNRVGAPAGEATHAA